jgi:hypothetical protein
MLLVGVLGVACTSLQPIKATLDQTMQTPQRTSSTSSLPVDWTHRWLKGVPCEAPCWESIMPGRTSPAETVAVLLNSTFVMTASISTNPQFPNLGFVNWTYSNGSVEGGAVFNIQASSPTVYAISPGFPSAVRLSDVMKTYGDPKYVVAAALRNPHSDGTSYALRIIFWPQGILLSKDGLVKPTLDDDTEFEQVTFFEPTEQALKAELAGLANHPEWMVPWQGLNGFDFYCKDKENGRVCSGQP